MKTHVLLLLAFTALTTVSAYAQTATPSVVFRSSHSFNTDDVAFNSPTVVRSNAMEIYHYSDWKVSSDGSVTKSKAYRRALHNRNMGIGLMVGGGASLVLGAALMTDGIIGIKRGNSWNSGNTDLAYIGHLYETYFGAVFGVAGFGMTIPGAIVFSRGVSKMKKVKEHWNE